MALTVQVLGSAAGGGFPQWNCNCRNCSGFRAGSLKASARTQSSIAISSAGYRWVLCNVSPDVHRQIAAHPPLRPQFGVRDTPIAGAILTDGQIDHAAGLLLLREHREALDVWATDPVCQDLDTDLPLLLVLDRYCGIRRNRLAADGTAAVIAALPGIRVSALPVDGRPGPYSTHRGTARVGDTVALVLRDEKSSRQLFYAPGLGAVSPHIERAMQESACVLVDGTFWDDDEMIREKVSTKHARDIGHLPQSGPGGMVEVLSRLPPSTRRVLIHINNTNPILDETSTQRAELADAGIEVAFDGMEIRL